MAKAVRFYDVGAGAKILGMNIHNQRRLGLVERLKAAVDEHPFAVQQRAHRAITDEHTFI